MKKMGKNERDILDIFEQWLREISAEDPDDFRVTKNLSDMFKGIDHPDDMDF